MAWTNLSTFTVGQVLTSATMNAVKGNLEMGHLVCTSSNRPPSPDPGAMIYETDTGYLRIWNGSGWQQVATEDKPISGSVVQMAFGSTSTEVTHNTTTRIATGLEATITPKFATSQIVVQASVQVRTPTTGNEGVGFDIRRNGTVIYSDGSNYRIYNDPADYAGTTVPLYHLDSPASTSSLTYSVFFASYASRIVQPQDDSRYASTMLLLEVAA